MTVRRLDPDTLDIVTTRTLGQFATEREEIAQTVNTRLALFLGEYFRDVTDGTPWYEVILGKGASADIADATLRNRIVNSPGVIRLTSYSSDYDLTTRKLSVTAGIMTKYGIDEITYNG